MTTRILCIAGTRPNFVKVAPVARAFRADSAFDLRLVHTGQHYDDSLSGVFFSDLQIPLPDIRLDVGSGTHAAQTAEIMARFEPVLTAEQPHAVIVVGDVNSTVACALVSAKFQSREFRWRHGLRTRPLVVHVEAGLRSFDNEMPEEINRKVTDAISDILFVSEPSGLVNLRNEGVSDDRVFFVGNVMIDTLLAARDRAMSSPVLANLGLDGAEFGLVTLHRPSNVDDPATLKALLGALDEVAVGLKLVFPVHPRTRARLSASDVSLPSPRWTVTDPLGYLDFLKLQATARIVFTDSGGVQEETTILGVPCVTLRENTERPVTLTEGTNVLAGAKRESILDAAERALRSGRAVEAPPQPKYWDGKAAGRILDVMRNAFEQA